MKPGTRIGSYEIITRIDAGGMGVVYRARHVGLGREVALKVLASNLTHSEKIRHRFKQEAYVQAQLDHPHIVQVSDFVEESEHYALVMELVEGGSLADKLDAKPGPWSEAEIRDIFEPIVDGVAYAHGRGVVHRDIKPENVLLAKDGTPKVADFGIAKILSADSHLTRTGTKLGTAPYMSPEQFEGKKDLGTEADVYALGMLAWRMLMGILPVEPDNIKNVFAFYLGSDPLPPISDVVPHISPEFGRLIDASLSIDPTQRPKDAGVMQRVLSVQTRAAEPRPLIQDMEIAKSAKPAAEEKKERQTIAPEEPTELQDLELEDPELALELYLDELNPPKSFEEQQRSAIGRLLIYTTLIAIVVITLFAVNNSLQEPEERSNEPIYHPATTPLLVDSPDEEVEEISTEGQEIESKIGKEAEADLEARRERVRQSSALRFVTASGDDDPDKELPYDQYDYGLGGGSVPEEEDDALTQEERDAMKALEKSMGGKGEDDETKKKKKKKKEEKEDLSYRNVTYRTLDPNEKKEEAEAKEKKQHGTKANVLLSNKMKTKGGRINKDGVVAAIKRRKSSIRRCYEEALRSNEGAGGKLMVEFTVGLHGRVTSSRVVKNSTGSSAIAECILRRLEGWRFPKPEDGKPVTVRYPFVFSRK